MKDVAKGDEGVSPRERYEPPRLHEIGAVAELTQKDGDSVLDDDN